MRQLGSKTVFFSGILAFLFTGPLCSETFAQTKPQQIQEADVVNQIQSIKQADLLKINEPFVVDGIRRFDGWFIVTDKIEFKPNSQLIFTSQALQNRRNFYIVAKEIVSDDPNSPGTISYEPQSVDNNPAKSGQGSTGPNATSDGQSGGQGGQGDVGFPGSTGFSAPSLTITTMGVPSSGPYIFFEGGQGGIGGQGQRGGDGGAGAKGSPASQSLVDCKAGGGRGGDGGPGGVGGRGGPGGRGGAGGTVTIIAPADLLPSLSEKFRVNVSQGVPGNPGAPGPGGFGGPAGPGGQEARPYCHGGSSGNPGTPGPNGSAGSVGLSGVAGDFLVGAITPDLFADISK